jgi:hypothetical protein
MVCIISDDGYLLIGCAYDWSVSVFTFILETFVSYSYLLVLASGYPVVLVLYDIWFKALWGIVVQS